MTRRSLTRCFWGRVSRSSEFLSNDALLGTGSEIG